MLNPWVESEIQKLDAVLLAKPNLGLQYLSTSNRQAHLFNGVPRYETICEQHTFFIDVLKQTNVHVLFIDDLLAETLTNKDARFWLAEQLLSYMASADLYDKIQKKLFDIDAKLLSQYLIAGLQLTDLFTEMGNNYFEKDNFLLPPLTNNYFTRDTSTWLFDGVVIAAMKYPIRNREALLLSCIYRFHPKFNYKKPCKIWFDGSLLKYADLHIEGGDLILINKDILLIGCSERTNKNAITVLAKTLFAHTNIKTIIVPELPKERYCIHLDMIISMVNYNTFCLAKNIVSNIRTVWEISRNDYDLNFEIELSNNLIASLEKNLGTAIELISLDNNHERNEQLTCANNLLTISPGTVISYEQNSNINKLMQDKGIRVITIPGSQLILGHGGTHCMSCPVVRESVEDIADQTGFIEQDNEFLTSNRVAIGS